MINAYTIMMAIVIFLAFIMRGYKKENRWYVIIACVAMFVILGLRDAYTVGNDSSSSYLHMFQGMKTKSWQSISEISKKDNPAMSFLMKLVYIMSNGDYQVFIIVISAFIMICFAHFVYRYSCNPLQSFIYYWGLLLYAFMFNGLKQSIAMAFVLLSFDAIMDKRLIRFVLLVLLGAMFHFPAIVFLPAYFIAKMKLDKGYLIMLAGVLLATFIFKDKLLDLMVSVYDTDLTGEVTLRFLSNKAIIMIVIVVAAIILRPPVSDDELYCKLLSFMGVAIVFQTFCRYNNTFERLADYYFQFAVVFIPLVFEKIELKKESFLTPNMQNIVKTVAPIVFCAFGVWRFANYVQNDLNMVNYSFCF